MVLSFESYEFDPDLFELRNAGQVIPLEPQVHDVLAYLLAHRERVVTKEELLDHVWGDRFVSESALTSRIKAARRAIGDDGHSQRLIRTIHGRGYRFVAPVQEAAPAGPLPATAPVAGGTVRVPGNGGASVPVTSPGETAELQAARAAVGDGRWDDAIGHFSAVGEPALDPDDLAQWAEAAWWAGRIDEAVRLRQLTYQRFLAAGEPVRAARTAIDLAEDHYHRGASAVDSGWLGRANRLLADHHGTIEYLWYQRSRCVRLLEQEHDHDAALIYAEAVLAGAAEHHDLDLVAVAMQDKGRALVALGEVAEGMALIDEAMVTAVSEDLQRRTVGRLYCNMMATCMAVADYDRAAQWTDEAAAWCGTDTTSAFPGVCSVHRAGVLRRRGAFAAAQAEAERSTAKADFVEVAAAAWYELGEIRLRQGDLDGAAQAFVRAHTGGVDPQPGLAQLRHVRGEPAVAASMLRAVLTTTGPSPLERARLLPALAEAAAAAGDLATATDAASELARLAELGAPALKAAGRHAAGTVALAAVDPAVALDHFRAAARAYADLGLPYEASLARLGVAQACRVLDDCAAEELEAAAARATLAELGAVPIGMAAGWLDTAASP